MVIKIVLGIIFLWILLGIVITFIIFPNYLFKPKIKTTKKIKQVANKLKDKNPQKTLKKIYNFIIKNHYGISKSAKNKIFYLGRLFKNDVEENLENKIYLFCHAQNLMLNTLLINTKQFEEKDIKVKWFIDYTLIIHQYLLVSMGNKKVKLDPFYRIYKVLG